MTSQCPYFLGSCPLVAPPTSNPPPPPKDDFGRAPPPSSSSCTSGSSQLASPSLPPHIPPSPVRQGYPVPQPSLFERRKQYKAEMLQNQVQRQADGGQLQQRNPNPRTASASSSSSSSSSFPTSSYCLPPTVSTNSSRAPSSEISPISSYNPYPAYPPAYPRNSSFDFDGYPSTASSSSSSNPYPLPSVSFDEAFLHSPNAYPFQHQSDPSSGRGFADVLQLHNSPPVLFQQPHAPVDEDEYLSSSTASFAHSPTHLDGGGGWQEAAYGSLDYDDGLVRQGSTRPELVRVVENRRSQDEPMSTSSQLPQGNNETLGVQQTAFISKLWHVITHIEYSQFIRWSKDGLSFVVVDPESFAALVLPRFFRHSKLTSFVRQLNLYSFQRVSVTYLQDDALTTSANRQPLPSGSGSLPSEKTVVASGFSHPSFQRNRPELLSNLHPRVPGGKKASSSSSSKREGKATSKKSASRGIGRS